MQQPADTRAIPPTAKALGAQQGAVGGMPRNSSNASLSGMWDWAVGRQSPPASHNASATNLAAMGGGDSPLQSKGMSRSSSVGSQIWSWAFGRSSPGTSLPATPEASPLPDYATRGYTSPTAQVVKVPL